MNKTDNISILYVEDQDDVRLFLSKILSRHYANVYLAENGQQGFELFKQHNPDIVISDIKMPVMDGLSMSSRIKDLDPNAKIILTTAHSDMEYFIQSIDIGISQYILKPIDRQKLYSAIDSCKQQVLLERENKKQNEKLIKTNELLTAQERELRETLQKTIALKEIVSRSEENFRKVAENIQDAFWLEDNSRILFVNKAYEILFEAPSSRLFENPDIFKDFIHPDDHQQFIKSLKKHEQTRKGTFNTEFRIITPSGKTKNIWYRDVFITSDKSTEFRRLSTLTDISWKIENERLQQNLLVAEKSSQLKQRLLANVSHEINTPINGIMGMVSILEQSSLNQEQKSNIASIKNSVQELMETTKNLLDITELDEKKKSLHIEKVHSGNLFVDLLDKYARHAQAKELRFEAIFEDSLPQIFYTDIGKAEQLLEHLLFNALKFTDKGGIKVEISSSELDQHQYLFTMKVEDTGIGISKEFQDNMFQLFSQEEDSDSRSYEGLGLGLSICQKIAHLLHGNISVDSIPGKGSIFSFQWPVKKSAEKQAVENSEQKNSVPDLNIDVLCVEDKEVNQKILSIMLQNAHCNVDIANNGIEAIEMYEKKAYDIILMDIQMPLMDGLTATKELRKKHKMLPPVIGVSANALQADAEYYIAQGLDDYISKPVIPAILYSKIEEWLKKESNSPTKNHKTKSDKNNTTKEKVNTPEYQKLEDLDMSTYETLKEQTRNDETILNDLYTTFLEEADSLLQKTEKSLASHEKEMVRESTHALKGLSATVGALKVYHITSEMDKLHKKDIYDKSDEFFRLLKADYKRLKSLIRSEILKT